ncbi:hypothetical protein [Acetobacter senegalensis]|uniref:hypothetical protein n=1 Tax=Acetobacter senegalensis TaxID=446692 RepID=UPI00264B37E4|nr:hypothetical protein [Acetobacter senegalensis]MDN7350456.1 hypothetical protein [Acetobacter senegalensis]
MENLRGHLLAMEMIMARMIANTAHATGRNAEWLDAELAQVKEQLSSISSETSEADLPAVSASGKAVAETVFSSAKAQLDGSGTISFKIP